MVAQGHSYSLLSFVSAYLLFALLSACTIQAFTSREYNVVKLVSSKVFPIGNLLAKKTTKWDRGINKKERENYHCFEFWITKTHSNKFVIPILQLLYEITIFAIKIIRRLFICMSVTAFRAGSFTYIWKWLWKHIFGLNATTQSTVANPAANPET